MKLKAYRRDLKENLRRLRASGFVPGVVYGKELKEAIPVKVPIKELRKLNLKSLKLFELEIDANGESFSTGAILKEIQRDVLSPRILHIDFQAVKATDKVTVEVPVVVVGADVCIGIKKGGVLQVNLKTLELEVPAGDIPSEIKVDISNLDIADSLHVGELELPESYKPLDPPDSAIVTIVPPEAEETEEEEVPQA